jgi:hypothetical protein
LFLKQFYYHLNEMSEPEARTSNIQSPGGALEPVIISRDGAEMLLILKDEFIMGLYRLPFSGQVQGSESFFFTHVFG